jgi:hypothetical protein
MSSLIRGIVRDENDTPLSDVSVFFVGGPAHADIAASTGRDGSFAFADLKPGIYRLKARNNALESDIIEVRIRRSQRAVVQIWLLNDVVVEPADTAPDVRDISDDFDVDPEDFIPEM